MGYGSEGLVQGSQNWGGLGFKVESLEGSGLLCPSWVPPGSWV